MCIPALVIVTVVISTRADSIPIPSTRYAMALLLAVAVFVAAQSPQCVSRDLRFRLTSLYFSRPLLRQDYVLAKYAAMVCALLILLAAPLAILYVGGLLAELPFWPETRHFLLGLAGALMFALVLASVGLVVATITPRRGLGVAAVITVLLISYSAVAAVQGIAYEEGEESLAGYAGLFSPFTLVDGLQVWLLRAEPSTPAGPPGATGGLVFLGLAVALVAGCYLVLLRRYRGVSVS
jgi:ABC-2 type transport system permease protein